MAEAQTKILKMKIVCMHMLSETTKNKTNFYKRNMQNFDWLYEWNNFENTFSRSSSTYHKRAKFQEPVYPKVLRVAPTSMYTYML